VSAVRRDFRRTRIVSPRSTSTREARVPSLRPLLAAAVLVLACTARAGAQEASADSAAAAATVHRFHQALAAGDSAAALALLTGDVEVLESGGVETRAEYRSHHLGSDIEFARAVPGRRGPVKVRVRGDVAWATSTSITEGIFRSRPVNSAGAELMVLVRTPEGWRIAAIHWSSRRRS
jgi:ketosteroid isomerase-like protein